MLNSNRRVFLVAFAWTFAFLMGILAGAFLRLQYGLPKPSELQDYRPMVSTKLLDRKGQVVADFAQERREPVTLDRIPEVLKVAMVAVEDKRFYHHWGIDIIRFFGMNFYNLKHLRVVQGGSTITQQLARNMFLTMQQTLDRKLKEALLAIEIERAFSKDEILELYFNQVYYGHGAYGIQAAAETFFGKNVKELNLVQLMTLAALPANPGIYSPYDHPDRLTKRRNLFLKKLLDIKKLTKAEYDKAAREPVKVVPRKPRRNEAPYFVEEIRKYLEATYGPEFVYTSGATIYTTLDLKLQRAANAAIADGLDRLEKNYKLAGSKRTYDSLVKKDTALKPNYLQGAVVAIDPKSGGIRAMVGGRSITQSWFNRATQAKRQPGSAFKVFVYTAAIDNGRTPEDIEDDAPLRLIPPGGGKPYEPHNFDFKFMGPIDLYTALVLSRNVVAVRLISEIGPEIVARYARRMGINEPLNPYYSLALGACEVTPLEMTSAFGVLVNEGVRVLPRYFSKIVDRNGRIVEESFPEEEAVLSPTTCQTMVGMMEGVVNEGTATSVRSNGFERAAGGKTGTTDDYADAWFVGFTPNLACGVWVGYDQRRSIFRGATGGSVAAPIWAHVMSGSEPPEDDAFSFSSDYVTQASSAAKTDSAKPDSSRSTNIPYRLPKPAPAGDSGRDTGTEKIEGF
jgi:penicillin-binding protein 1A